MDEKPPQDPPVEPPAEAVPEKPRRIPNLHEHRQKREPTLLKHVKAGDLLSRVIEPPRALTTFPFFIEEGARHILFGPTNVGKSMIAIFASIVVARNGYRVLYLPGESDEYEMQDRIRCIINGDGDGDGMRAQIHENLIIGEEGVFPIYDPATREPNPLFVRTIAALKPDLIVVDPYVSFAVGSENDVESARDFTNALNRLCVLNRIAIMLVHHQGRGEGEHMRGSSALDGWPNWTYHLTGNPDPVDMHMVHMAVDCQKHRGKRRQPRMAYEMILSEDETTTYFRVASAEANDAARANQPDDSVAQRGQRRSRQSLVNERRDAICAILSEAGGALSPVAILDALGLNLDDRTLRRDLSTLIETGRIREVTISETNARGAIRNVVGYETR